ncbi:unnamed protein product, partial [Rotaria magnacalcarata]
SLTIDSAELISGDVNIRSSSSSSSQYFTNNFPSPSYDASQIGIYQQAGPVTTTAPTIAPSRELAGIYAFSINETFILNPQTNYILPIFRPTVDIERYGLI